MGRSAQRKRFDLIVNIAILLTLAIANLPQPTPYLSKEPLFDSGEHSNAAVSELGSLSRAMILNDKRIVLLDGHTLLFINPWTGALWTAGGKGDGPGEFAGSGPQLGLFRGQDKVMVWDPNIGLRLTTFSDTSELLDARRLDLSGVAFRHWTANMMGVFADGSFAFIDREPPNTSDTERTLAYVAEVSEEGKWRNIVEFPDAQSGNVLFRHFTSVSFGGDLISVADTESNEVIIVDRSGVTVSRMPMPGQRVEVSRARLDAARAAAREDRRRGDEIFARHLEAIGRSTEKLQFREQDYTYNKIAPPISHTQFDGENRLWICHSAIPGHETSRWTVWDGEDHVFSITMPAGYSFLDARGDLVLLRVRDSLGVERAVIHRLVWE